MGKPNKKLKNQWKNPLKNLSKNEKHNFSFALSLPAILGFTPHRAHLARPPEAAQWGAPSFGDGAGLPMYKRLQFM